MPRIVCMSDTHGLHAYPTVNMPEGDILVHAGDFCNQGTIAEVETFGRWLRGQPYRHKIVIAGNHDWPFERVPSQARSALGHGEEGIEYLEDRLIEVDGLRIYGSPWQPEFCGWAFNLPRNGLELKARWAAIPEGLDILLTHGPALGVLDDGYAGRKLGCELLAARLDAMERRPRLHVFGHIHPGYGSEHVTGSQGRWWDVNASVCDEAYYPVNPVQVIEI